MISLVETLINRAECFLGYGLGLDVEISYDRSSFPKKRDMAYCNGLTIVLSDKLALLPIENQIAVIAHEIAHCDLIQSDIEHTERDADKHAEDIFAIKISYDHNNVQTTSIGKRPRPIYLPK